MTIRRTTVYMQSWAPALLRQLAFALGLVTGRGKTSGIGDISELVNQLAGLVATYGVDVMAGVLRPMLDARNEQIAAVQRHCDAAPTDGSKMLFGAQCEEELSTSFSGNRVDTVGVEYYVGLSKPRILK